MFRRAAIIVIAVIAFSASSASFAAGGAPRQASSVSGVFVSLGTDPSGTLVSIDCSGSVTSLRLSASVSVSEDEAGSAPQAATLLALKPGEPVELRFGPDGAVTTIVAHYATVATQVIAAQNGFVIAAEGTAYKLVGTALTTADSLETGTYVLMRTDPATGDAFDLAASRLPFRAAGPGAAVVAVTFVVRVPANSPPTDAVYLTTNSNNWTPNAIRLTPLSGGRWTAKLQLAAGTQIEYRYTRGSWATDERTAAGTPIANRAIVASKSGGAQNVDDVVARWADLPS